MKVSLLNLRGSQLDAGLIWTRSGPLSQQLNLLLCIHPVVSIAQALAPSPLQPTLLHSSSAPISTLDVSTDWLLQVSIQTRTRSFSSSFSQTLPLMHVLSSTNEPRFLYETPQFKSVGVSQDFKRTFGGGKEEKNGKYDLGIKNCTCIRWIQQKKT